eukprot:413205_1
MYCGSNIKMLFFDSNQISNGNIAIDVVVCKTQMFDTPIHWSGDITHISAIKYDNFNNYIIIHGSLRLRICNWYLDLNKLPSNGNGSHKKLKWNLCQVAMISMSNPCLEILNCKKKKNILFMEEKIHFV